MNFRNMLQMLLFFVSLMICNIFAAEEGFLTVITEPSGVEVWLGSNYIGNSPINDKKVPAGQYEIRLVDPIQRISVAEHVIVITNRTVIVEKKLTPKYGALNVNSIPEGAEAYLTVPLGKTPLNSDFIVPGKYLVEIRHPDKAYKPSLENVVINEGTSVSLMDTLDLDESLKKGLNAKAALRLGLGAGALAGFIWAIVENGNYHVFKSDARMDKAKSARIRRTVGIVTGSICVVGFEVVAFF